MINLNSPTHNDWQPLKKLDIKHQKIMDRSLTRVLAKQHSNRIYTWDYLTDSFMIAYPDYIPRAKPFPIHPVRHPQSQIIINHNTRELIMLGNVNRIE